MALSKEEIRKEEVEDVRYIMSSAQGRRFVRRLLAKSGLHQSVFRDRPLLTPEQRPVFNGAQRDFGQWIEDEVIVCAPASYRTMNDEAMEKVLVERLTKQEEGKHGDE